MIEQPLEDLLTRLERERLDADRLYNDALTAVNRAIQAVPAALPSPPPNYDGSGLVRLNAHWDVLSGTRPSLDATWKGRLRAFIWSLVGPPFEMQRQFNAALVDHLNRNAASAQAVPETTTAVIDALGRALEGLYRFQSLLVQYLMTITAFVDSRDRRLGAEGVAEQLRFVEQRLFALGREMDRIRTGDVSGLAAASPVVPTGPVPRPVGPAPDAFVAPIESMTYVGFEDRFRGSEDEIRRRVEDYLPLLEAATDLVDVGCGRGELLDALRARGLSARGVDTNHAMVELCRSRGLDVDESDALTFLQRQAAASVGGLVAIQVVEHFAPAYLTAFLAAAYQAMRSGAPLILETINPACWSAFFDTYIRDLTHQRPLHPDTLKYLVQASGFTQVDVQFRQPVREVDRLRRVDASAHPDADAAWRASAEVVNDHAAKLNARLFSSFDYVVVARR